VANAGVAAAGNVFRVRDDARDHVG